MTLYAPPGMPMTQGTAEEDTGYDLPAPGTDPQGVSSYIDRLVYESLNDQRRLDWLEEAERNLQLYNGQHWTTPTPQGEIRLVLNRTQNALVSLLALQAGDPPKITFTPRESGEPPIYYLNTDMPQAEAIAQEYPTDMATGLPLDFTQPLPQELAEELKIRFSEERAIAAQFAAQGMPSPVMPPPENLLVEVNDSTTSQALQVVYDAMWEACFAQVTYTENVLNKNILGWQPTVVEFDDDTKQYLLTNAHPKHVFPDPIHFDNRTWDYCIWDQPIGFREARKKFPNVDPEILRNGNGSRGPINFGGRTASYDPAAMYQQNFEREMVVVRTAWIRCQYFPMTREQAAASGKLEARQTPVPGSEQWVEDENATPQLVQESTTTYHFPGEEEEAQQDIEDPENKGTTIPNPRWPMRYGIRQVTLVNQEVVEDKECEWPQIPIVVNRNVAIPFSTYGQGEPKRLEGLQMGVNRILSAFVTHHMYNAYPPEVIPDSVVELMDEAIRTMRTQPGQRVVIPQDVLIQLGDMKKVVGSLETPQMGADFWRLLDLLVQYIDMEGNQADVIQGDAASGWSGKTVESLQGAANQVIRGKAIFTEFYLRNLTELLVYPILFRMTPEDLKKIMGQFPIQALTALHDRLKRLYYDVSVEIASGSGASRTSKTQQYLGALGVGIPVSIPTIMQGMDLDSDAEVQKQADFVKKQQAAMGPMPSPQDLAAAPGGPGAPGDTRPQGEPKQRVPSEGNGSASNNNGNGRHQQQGR